MKNTTRTERLSCAISIILLVVCALLVVYFTVIAKKVKDDKDIAPHEWFITREDWLADLNVTNTSPIAEIFKPLHLVVVAHTVSPECYTFINCAAELRTMQGYFLHDFGYDIPYNFLIGNDGRVYEGRGWNKIGAHTLGYNSCSLGLAFVGDYREGSNSFSKLTAAQQWRAHLLFEQGVKGGYLHRDFQVVGAMDLRNSLSPGANVYKAIRLWSTYAHDNLFKGRTCDQIQELFDDKTNENCSVTISPTTIGLDSG